MTGILDVARLQLGAWRWLVVAGGILTLSFGLNLAISTLGDVSFVSGGVAVLPVFAIVMASQLVSQWWPFASGLSVTRSDFYRANLLVGLLVAAGMAAAVLALTALERVTGGWGTSLVYFGVVTPLVDGPGQEWLVLVVLCALAWGAGLLFGAVHKRWGGLGTTVAIGASVVVPGALVTLATVLEAWPAVGRWFASQPVLPLVLGWPSLLTVALVGAGWVVLRRAEP